DVPDAEVSWELEEPSGTVQFRRRPGRGEGIPAVHDADSGEWRAQVAPRAISVSVSASGFADESESVTVATGETRTLTFKLVRVASVRVEFVCEGRPELTYSTVRLVRNGGSDDSNRAALYPDDQRPITQNGSVRIGTWSLQIEKIRGY